MQDERTESPLRELKPASGDPREKAPLQRSLLLFQRGVVAESFNPSPKVLGELLTAGCIDTDPLALGRILWPISRVPCADRTYAPGDAGHVH